MACIDYGTLIEMAPRETLTLPDVRGGTLRVTRGTVWITQENDPQDIVLRPGDNWTVERNGLTIVESQSDVSLCVAGRRIEGVIGRRRIAARTRSPWAAARDALAAFFASPKRGPAPYL